MSTPKVERLVNLTIALLEARRPMTLAEIRRRTGFYAQRDTESARRMFERDKDDLRKLGVPVEVRDVAFEEEPGYVVARRDYELADVDLDADEVAALALAVSLTGGEGTRLALTKLAARAPDPAEAAPLPPVRVALDTSAVDAVADAVVHRRALRFDYRTADGDRSRRTVDPYAVAQRRGAWYLVGRDHARDELRTFRLDRFVGAAQLVGDAEAFSAPDDLDLAALVSGASMGEITAELAVAPSARWAVESRGGRDTGRTVDGLTVMRIEGIDPDRDLGWLTGVAADLAVLGPQELVDRVRDRLAKVAELHGGER